MYHYNPNTEPQGAKLEARGALPKTWSAFEDYAKGQAQYFIDVLGTNWEADLLSQDLDANGKPFGLLYILKDLHRGARERKWNIRRVVTTWEEGFDHWRTSIFRKLPHLVLRTGKLLPSRDEMMATAFSFGPDGQPNYVPPLTFRSSSSEGFLRSVVFPRMAFDDQTVLDTIVDREDPSRGKPAPHHGGRGGGGDIGTGEDPWGDADLRGAGPQPP